MNKKTNTLATIILAAGFSGCADDKPGYYMTDEPIMTRVGPVAGGLYSEVLLEREDDVEQPIRGYQMAYGEEEYSSNTCVNKPITAAMVKRSIRDNVDLPSNLCIDGTADNSYVR